MKVEAMRADRSLVTVSSYIEAGELADQMTSAFEEADHHSTPDSP